MTATKIIQDLQDTKNQLGPTDEENFLFFLKESSFGVCEAQVTITSTNIGNAFTVGHPLNGVVGPAIGVGGGQVVVGAQALGSSEIIYTAQNLQCPISLGGAFLLEDESFFLLENEDRLFV
jgi:hypothetical protein